MSDGEVIGESKRATDVKNWMIETDGEIMSMVPLLELVAIENGMKIRGVNQVTVERVQ